jgi:hypothetical protein
VVAVEPPAVLPDLSLPPSERLDVAHVHHGLGKVLEEEVEVGGVGLDEPGRLAALGEQDLVGVEQALAGEDVLEVQVVELGRRGEVQREQVVVAAGARAVVPQVARVGRVQREVRHGVAGLVVQPLPEAGAAGQPDGVAAGERHHVHHVQALVPELGDDGGQRVVGRRDVVVGGLQVRRQRVAPAQRHVPVRPAHEGDGVAGGDREDVRAGDDAGAGVLKGHLDLVDQLQPSDGVLVGVGVFLGDDGRAVVEQQRTIAALHVRTRRTEKGL